MNYKELLTKYMKYLHDITLDTWICDYDSNLDTVQFDKSELEELKKISEGITK